MGEAVAGPVGFPAPVEVVFDYLTDPVNRPDWQSSLRRVEVLDPGPPHVGQRWVDVTVPGLRPQMSTTVLEPPRRWVEHGEWRGIALDGELVFTPAGDGCTVTATATFRAAGVWGPLLPMLGIGATRAVGADLRRAAARLTARGTGK
ncbi:MAG: SRPBCC family protein [Marmoricola sp.]